MVELITVCDYFLLPIDLIKAPLMRSITHLHCRFPNHFKVPELIYHIYHTIYSDLASLLCDWLTSNNPYSFFVMSDLAQATSLSHFKNLSTARALNAKPHNVFPHTASIGPKVN